MSKSVHPDLFRIFSNVKNYFWSKNLRVVSNIDTTTSLQNDVDNLHNKLLLKKYLIDLYRYKSKKIAFYPIAVFVNINKNSSFYTLSILRCLKGPELPTIRKRSPKIKEKKKLTNFRVKISRLRKIFDSLLKKKNFWLKVQKFTIAPILSYNLKNFLRKDLLSLSKNTIDFQRRIFYSLKLFSREKFFEEGFCIMNSIFFNKNAFLESYCDYVSRYFKRYKNHKRFYNFLKTITVKYTKIPSSCIKSVVVQIKGRFFKNKRSMKRKFFSHCFALSRIKLNCSFNETFSITKTGSFGVKIWVLYS